MHRMRQPIAFEERVSALKCKGVFVELFLTTYEKVMIPHISFEPPGRSRLSVEPTVIRKDRTCVIKCGYKNCTTA